MAEWHGLGRQGPRRFAHPHRGGNAESRAGEYPGLARFDGEGPCRAGRNPRLASDDGETP